VPFSGSSTRQGYKFWLQGRRRKVFLDDTRATHSMHVHGRVFQCAFVLLANVGVVWPRAVLKPGWGIEGGKVRSRSCHRDPGKQTKRRQQTQLSSSVPHCKSSHIIFSAQPMSISTACFPSLAVCFTAQGRNGVSGVRSTSVSKACGRQRPWQLTQTDVLFLQVSVSNVVVVQVC